MTYFELKQNIGRNIFTSLDVKRAFFEENLGTIKLQLSRWVKKGLVFRLKRGWYCFDKNKLDELNLAGLFYQPSYVSMETALHYHGLIPDIPFSVTSLTTITTKKISSVVGQFLYYKIIPELYWGFTIVRLTEDNFCIASKEKALLDYIYVRKVRKRCGLRLNINQINKRIYDQYAQKFPAWVRKVRLL